MGKKVETIVLKNRPRCGRCSCVHSVDHRVNWWDQNGAAYGEKTKPKDVPLFALCDDCAEIIFEARRAMLSKYDIRWAKGKELAQAQKMLQDAGWENVAQSDGLYAIAVVGSTIVSTMKVSQQRESLVKERYIVTLEGVYTLEFYRNLGSATQLGQFIHSKIKDSVSYLKLADRMTKNEKDFVVKYLVDSLGNKWIQNAYQFRWKMTESEVTKPKTRKACD